MTPNKNDVIEVTTNTIDDEDQFQIIRDQAIRNKAYLMKQFDQILHAMKSVNHQEKQHAIMVGTIILHLAKQFTGIMIETFHKMECERLSWDEVKAIIIADIQEDLNCIVLKTASDLEH